MLTNFTVTFKEKHFLKHYIITLVNLHSMSVAKNYFSLLMFQNSGRNANTVNLIIIPTTSRMIKLFYAKETKKAINSNLFFAYKYRKSGCIDRRNQDTKNIIRFSMFSSCNIFRFINVIFSILALPCFKTYH